jgi:hypothetical protein
VEVHGFIVTGDSGEGSGDKGESGATLDENHNDWYWCKKRINTNDKPGKGKVGEKRKNNDCGCFDGASAIDIG